MQSCRDLKNFAGVFAIMEGLTQADVQEQESAWHLVTDHLLRTYRELQDLVDPDNGYHRYRQDVKVIYQSPLIPCLSESDPTRLHVYTYMHTNDYNTYTPTLQQTFYCRIWRRLMTHTTTSFQALHRYIHVYICIDPSSYTYCIIGVNDIR